MHTYIHTYTEAYMHTSIRTYVYLQILAVLGREEKTAAKVSDLLQTLVAEAVTATDHVLMAYCILVAYFLDR